MDILSQQEELQQTGGNPVPEERPKSSPLFDNLAVPAPYSTGYGNGAVVVQKEEVETKYLKRLDSLKDERKPFEDEWQAITDYGQTRGSGWWQGSSSG